jgi:hypothetical protein
MTVGLRSPFQRALAALDRHHLTAVTVHPDGTVTADRDITALLPGHLAQIRCTMREAAVDHVAHFGEHHSTLDADTWELFRNSLGGWHLTHDSCRGRRAVA